MILTELREFIKLALLEKVTSAMSTSAGKALARASKSKSAGPVSSILLNNLPSGWQASGFAPTGSNATDIVLLSPSGEEVSVEVKDYGNNSVFKVEISMTEESSLAELFNISKSSFAATKNDITRRIVGKNKKSIVDKATSALKSDKREYVGLTEVDTQGLIESRHIIVVKGEKGDWSRVRHASSPSGSARMLYTVSSDAIAARAAEAGEVSLDTLADSVKGDFTSKGDQYIFLYDGKSTIRGFQLGETDPLGLGLPTLKGSDIFTYRFATHGGGLRPSIKIVVRRESGKILK